MNILGAEVSIDNQATPGLIPTYKNKSIKFTNDGGGLFHCDVKDFTLPIHTNVSTTKDSSQEAMTQVHAVSCLSTVEANKSKFSKKGQLKAKKARDLQHDLLRPSQAALIHYVESGQIQNCNITKLDILRAEAIYDPPLPHLQGKLTRQSLVKNHQTIVEGRESLNFKKTRLPFGAYAIVHSGTDNTMNSRGLPAIALKESNESNSFFFMSLKSGKRLNCNKWATLPIPENVIDEINEMGQKDKATNKAKSGNSPAFSLDDISEYPSDESFSDQADGLAGKLIDKHSEIIDGMIQSNMSGTDEDPIIGPTDTPMDIEEPTAQSNNNTVEDQTQLDQTLISEVDSIDFNINNAYDTTMEVDKPEVMNLQDKADDQHMSNNKQGSEISDLDVPTNQLPDGHSSDISDLDVPITQLVARNDTVDSSSRNTADLTSSDSSAFATVKSPSQIGSYPISYVASSHRCPLIKGSRSTVKKLSQRFLKTTQ